MLPQDLSCSVIGHQAQEGLSLQATQLTTMQASQVWTQAVETKLSLAPVQPVVHLPLWPQGRIWTNANVIELTTKKMLQKLLTSPSKSFHSYNDEWTVLHVAVPCGKWWFILSWANPAKLAFTARLRTSLLVGERGGTSRVSSSGTTIKYTDAHVKVSLIVKSNQILFI